MTTALDPTTQILLTVFGAALVTALAGFAGAAVQARRDHRRWVRERRFDAYVDWLKYAHEIRDVLENIERLGSEKNQLMVAIKTAVEARITSDDDLEKAKRTEELTAHRAKAASVSEELVAVNARRKSNLAQLIERGTAFFLLGPKPVAEAASHIADVMGTDSVTVSRAVEVMEREMRRALKITR
ncbi:hypothetical protein [Microbacterium sp. A84]|uniref:hypothetical protein n=1 Tax=Microbacterium sp. A84 TaxID=3450715 RepID=UPI003F42EBD9